MSSHSSTAKGRMTKPPLILQTDRLILKTVDQQDLQEIVAFEMRNIEFFRPWIAVYPNENYDERMRIWSQEYDDRLALRFVIYPKESFDRGMIGMCNYYNIVRGVFHGAYLGYKIDQLYVGKGFMSEAVCRSLQYLFFQENIHRVVATYMPNNQRSEKLVMGMGFEKECIAKKYLFINSRWEDHVISSKINPWWDEPQKLLLGTSCTPIIETKRLYLRRLGMQDIGNLLRIFSDPQAMQYYHSTLDREGVENWIQRNNSRYQDDGFGFFACILKDTNEFVGECGLIMQKDVQGRDEVEIGYQFIREFWNCGYGTEAAVACRDFAFNVLGINKVISLIRPENKASQKVAQKNGMTKDDQIIRWNVPIDVWSTTNSERCTNR
jgi:[ribosomal protein S5]-alanine N-acetyltransferase